MEPSAYAGTATTGKHLNTLRELLRAGKPTLATRVFSSWPLITEIVGNTGKFDYIEFLAEYAPIDQHGMENVVRAAELHRMGSIIKIDFANRAHVAQKAVASGFQGVMYADHRTPEQVEESIKTLRADCPQHGGAYGYTPRRLIGYNAGFSPMQFADMLQDIVCCFMIEKKEAVERIEEICAVPGVDMIQFGPYDYSMSCGMSVEDNAEAVRRAEEACIRAALKHGVRPRCEINSPQQAARYIQLGVRDFNIGGEVWNLASVWDDHGARMRDIIAQNHLVTGELHE